ncbi:adenosylmethionine decarboxylase [Catenovulum maritimum]|uniref:S-adenosylmethionine decarboxylase proenzyme n=1 Tax=Catenovulum maritimum TaxID=1513271 RepID=A0A0J8GTB0_9ALTE|nr:adenosylmethionine decarboxylase [Catenovulum maritimum]KMT63943.1 S-adenosylmethionine decarboxylase [Catenovulum maritimum]
MSNPPKKLKLHGFNNLTKSLSFSIYDISFALSAQHRSEYLEYIDEHYNADRLTDILKKVVEMIGANVLNIARQDYDPQGASVTILINEERSLTSAQTSLNEEQNPLRDSLVSHLDKSHICVHTYPESHPHNGISTFRADIEVSTCGLISPLKALNFLIHSFDPDVVTLDYRVRGFTRDVNGEKHYIDHAIDSIQNFMSEDIHALYKMIDVNVYQENIFHTKMLFKDFDIQRYLFGSGSQALEALDQDEASFLLKREIEEIFYGRNLPKP